MECQSCKAKLSEGSKFCTDCGAPVPIGCLSCGHGNPPHAKFCAECGTKLGGVSKVPAGTAEPPTAETSAGSSAERRQLTVMFCDLVGSTALSTQLDPEDLGDLIGEFRTACTKAVAGFGGSIAKYMGDGALIYFGYPEAYEDAAERAVLAGLALVEAASAVRRSSPGFPQLRIGIATSPKPTARSMALLGERATPRVMRLERQLSAMNRAPSMSIVKTKCTAKSTTASQRPWETC